MDFKRILRFQLVAGGGTLVNMGVLWLLKGRLEWPLLASGACAIELAILHNFTWHYFVTWRERITSPHARDYFSRLWRYNLVTASIDFSVNLTVLYLLNHFMGMHYIAANAIGMACGPVFKYLANERLIFKAAARKVKSAADPDAASD